MSDERPLKLKKNLAPRPTDLPSITAERMLAFYKDMLLIRRFEEKSGQLYGTGQIAGFCHLYIGQEAVIVGVQSVLKSNDTLITAYRDHGHMLACGMDPKGVMAELTGRSSGYSKGKGGSMHMFSREKNFFGGHGVVGAQVPIGTGIALAHLYLEDQGVCVTFMGDGAANQGQVYESFNMAALWKLPIVYIIENNGYAMGTSLQRGAAGSGLYHRGEPYGIPGEQVDGMDILAVREAAARALDHARCQQGPVLLEMMTYRYRGHSMSDSATYRTKEEVDDVKQSRDPIDRCRHFLREEGNFSEADLKKIDLDIKEMIKEAVAFAQESPEPEPAELFTDILMNTQEKRIVCPVEKDTR